MDAIKYFQKAIELEPEEGVLRFNLALTHMKNSDLDSAIQELRESIKFKPDYAERDSKKPSWSVWGENDT